MIFARGMVAGANTVVALIDTLGCMEATVVVGVCPVTAVLGP